MIIDCLAVWYETMMVIHSCIWFCTALARVSDVALACHVLYVSTARSIGYWRLDL